MSVSICPWCRKALDVNEDSIYCEHCGENILRQPPEDES